MKNTKNIIIGTLLVVILIMAVGYSSFATKFTLNGTAEIVGEWDVKISKVEAKEISENCNAGQPSFTNTSVTFNCTLLKPGDKVAYEITIQNAGTIDAVLNNILFTSDEINGSPAITYETSELNAFLPAGSQTSLTVTIEYNKDTTEVPEIKTKTITGIIEYVQN